MNFRRVRIAALLTAFAFLLAAGLSISRSSSAQMPAQKTSQSSQPAPSTSPSPAPVQDTLAQGYTLSPAQEAQAIAYASARHELYFLDVAYGFLLLVLLLQLRIAPVFRDLAVRAGENNFVRTIVFVPLLLLTIDVLSLPTAIWGHRLSLKYQQSIQGWGSWLVDWIKGEAIGVTIGILVVWILFAVIRKSPRKWWFYFWVAAVPLIILGAVIEPLIIEPLFFNYAAGKSATVSRRKGLIHLVGRAGLEIPRSRIFEMNASSKLKSVNAYVSGLGATRRVVVWDTSIRTHGLEARSCSSSATSQPLRFGSRARRDSIHVRRTAALFISRGSRSGLDAGALGRNLVHPRTGRSCRVARHDSAAVCIRFSVHADFKRLRPPPGTSGGSVRPGSDSRISA